MEIAGAVYESKVELMKYQSWLTATLTGVNKVPPFEQCFPKRREMVSPHGQVDIGAIFSGAGHQVVRAND